MSFPNDLRQRKKAEASDDCHIQTCHSFIVNVVSVAKGIQYYQCYYYEVNGLNFYTAASHLQIL